MTSQKLQFQAIQDPAEELIERLSDLAPENPFCTREYAKVRENLGARTLCLQLQEGYRLVSGCLAFLSSGRLNSRLEIASLPPLADSDLFWSNLFVFCRDNKIAVLSVQSFGSIESSLPNDRIPVWQKPRSEFRLDLTQPDLWDLMHRRHHRLIKKARTAGLRLRTAEEGTSVTTHCELANLSLDRRRGKGESVDGAITQTEVAAFIEAGCGEIYQAVLDETVLSTILIARSRKGCYAQSSGTAEQGRNIGASHFLFHEVALRMQAAGLSLFNVGGADEHSVGLQEFKQGQGTDRIDLLSAEYFTGSTAMRLAARAASLLRR